MDIFHEGSRGSLIQKNKNTFAPVTLFPGGEYGVMAGCTGPLI